MSTTHWDHEEESHELVQEFLQRELVGPELAKRVERLRSEGNPDEALRLILEYRRRRPGETIHQRSDPRTTE